MRYFSDITKKPYNTVEELNAAEKEWNDKHAAEIAEKNKAKEDAEKIKNKYNELVKIQKEYKDLVNKFAKDHKGYHLTITSSDYFDLFDNLFNRLFY